MNPIQRLRGANSTQKTFFPGQRACYKAIINNDGDLLFVSSYDSIYGYNLFTENLFHTYKIDDGVINDFDIDLKSEYIVAMGTQSITIFRIETGEALARSEPNLYLRCCCISPMNYIAVVTSTQGKQDPVLYSYHFISKNKNLQDKGHLKFDKPINCITYSDDSRIICGDNEGGLYQINTEQLTKSSDNSQCITKKISAHRGAINSIRKSWDGRMFATASADTTACTWNTETFEKLGTFPHSYLVSSVAFSPIYHQIVLASSSIKQSVARTSGNYYPINFFNLIFQEEFAMINCFQSPLNDVVFSPDGYTLVVTSEQGSFMVIRLGDSYRQMSEEQKEKENSIKNEIENKQYQNRQASHS